MKANMDSWNPSGSIRMIMKQSAPTMLRSLKSAVPRGRTFLPLRLNGFVPDLVRFAESGQSRRWREDRAPD
jgi:hypothetical protein